jgi:dienelactone hydrolase
MRLLRLALVAVITPIILLPPLSGAVGMWLLTHPACGGNGPSPADYKLPYREISIPTRQGGVYRGYFIPGSKDATIIAPPAYNGGRGGILNEAALLAYDGFNVLTFESRLCAGKTVHSLGYHEVEDVADVLDYLKQNDDGIKVNMSRVAMHGFSSAGATSLMAAARYPEIRAVLAEGGYHNADVQMGIETTTNVTDSMILFGARLTYRIATGEDPSVLSPIDAIKHIPPRPIFLVYGSRESSLNGAKAQLATARAADPNTMADLWIVPDAVHGSYVHTVGEEEYKRHVLPFYNCALLAQC